MSIKIVSETSGSGGARENTGPKPGSGKKRQICITVTDDAWKSALSIWNKRYQQAKPSWLVDKLVKKYVESGGKSLEVEAI